MLGGQEKRTSRPLTGGEKTKKHPAGVLDVCRRVNWWKQRGKKSEGRSTLAASQVVERLEVEEGKLTASGLFSDGWGRFGGDTRGVSGVSLTKFGEGHP